MPAAAGFINRELACLKVLFNRYVKDDVIPRNPVSRVRLLRFHDHHALVAVTANDRNFLLRTQTAKVAAVLLEWESIPEGCKNLLDFWPPSATS